MKFRKTRTAARSVYIYRFADGTVAVLHPGEQGVSTEIINFLHRLDDREVYRNLKQIKVKKYFTEPVDARESLEIQILRTHNSDNITAYRLHFDDFSPPVSQVLAAARCRNKISKLHNSDSL